MGLKLYHGGSKLANFLEWLSVVAFHEVMDNINLMV